MALAGQGGGKLLRQNIHQGQDLRLNKVKQVHQVHQDPEAARNRSADPEHKFQTVKP